MPNTIAERSGRLARELQSYRIDARPFNRQPIPPENFSTTITEGQILLWVGNANTNVHGDNKRRQAVVNVSEEAREFTRTFNMNRRQLANDLAAKTAILSSFPIQVPNGRVADYRIVGNNTGTRMASVEATVAAPKTSVSLLMGFDEIRQFIAMLPRRANSLDEAHAALRPNVSGDAIRQGEWFFDPATPAEVAEINDALTNRRMPFPAALESGSSHSAIVFSVGDKRFATGVVTDSRVKHHRPLVLDGWWRIVRNTEVLMASGTVRRRNTWD